MTQDNNSTSEYHNILVSCTRCGMQHIGIRLSNKKHTCINCGEELPI